MYNTFKITNLLIPQQTATADTCSMTHEEQVFQYGDDRNLLQIGWVSHAFLLRMASSLLSHDLPANVLDSYPSYVNHFLDVPNPLM